MQQSTNIEIAISEYSLTFDGFAIHFEPYYFAIAVEESSETWLDVFAHCMETWASSIRVLSSPDAAAYVPVGVFDECSTFLKAVRDRDDAIRVFSVSSFEEGYGIDLNGSNWCEAEHSIVTHDTREYGPHLVGEYTIPILIQAIERFTKSIRPI